MVDDFNVFDQGRKVTSVDGFLTGAGQQPRRPNFRELNDMPRPAYRQPPIQRPASAQFDRDILPTPVMANDEMPSAPELPKDQSGTIAITPSMSMSPQHTSPASVNPVKPSFSEQPRRMVAAPAVPSETNTPAPAATVKSPKPLKPKKKRSKVKTFLKVLGVLVLCAGLFFGGKVLYNVAKMTGNKNPFALLGALHRAPLKNENGRVNILVAGNSADDAGHNGASLTDSIMLLSVDTKKNSGMMLSIPRDLWVSIPREGHSKINAAYTYGGMDTLSGVVEDTLGLPVHYTALVNYTAFKELVDAIGGITITINSKDPRGIYDSSLDWTSRRCCALAKYPNGSVKLDGKQALNLARARGEGAGSYGFPQADFTRTEHQRMMLMAIAEKAKSNSTLINPMKLSSMFDAIGNNVSTDLKIDEINSLYSYAKEIPLDEIDSYNINTLKGGDTTMLANYRTPNGQSALIPAAGVDNFEDIATQLQRIFNATPVTREAAKAVVLNGTETTGLARTHASRLSRKGLEVLSQANATTQPLTTIIDNSNGKKPNTLTELKKTYTKATIIKDTALMAQYPGADFIIILGQEVIPKDTDN